MVLDVIAQRIIEAQGAGSVIRFAWSRPHSLGSPASKTCTHSSYRRYDENAPLGAPEVGYITGTWTARE
jgi:hypothetical protein